MQNHYFDRTDPFHPYTHSTPATPGTLAPGNALRGGMPQKEEGCWPCERDGEWTQVEDHRGKEGYVDGERTEIKELGPLPGGWSASPPPPAPEELAAKRVAEIKTRLLDLDLASIRPLRAIADGTATEDDRERLAGYESVAAALREELRLLAEPGQEPAEAAE